MDWIDKLEHKKKIRKMAWKMLWADFKDMICSWKVLLFLCVYFAFFLTPYTKGMEDFNAGGIYYFVLWVIMALYAMSERVFNFLPLSTKDIVYYLKFRTNLLTSWMTVLSVGSGVVVLLLQGEIFIERGLTVLLFLLISSEWLHFMTLYGYSKPEKVSLLDADVPKARKVRIVIYNVYSVCMLFAGMFISMFMEDNENAVKKTLFLLGAYLIMYIFRADAAGWVSFKEYTKAARRTMMATPEQLEQQKA